MTAVWLFHLGTQTTAVRSVASACSGEQNGERQDQSGRVFPSPARTGTNT